MIKESNLFSKVFRLSGGAWCLIAMYPIQAGAKDSTPNVVIQWNKAALQGVRDSKLGPPMVARALAIVHTCIYDAWAAYDESAIGTQLGSDLRQPPKQRNRANREKAISFAAYRATVDLFPQDKTQVFDPLMAALGYDPNDRSMDTSTPSGIGNAACAAVLIFRHGDGSNQLGNLTPGGIPYADYTGYIPVNLPSMVPVNPATVVNVNRWQPLQYVNGSGAFVTQTCVGPFWSKVTPFALTSADQFRDMISEGGPATFGTPGFVKQALDLIQISASLTDEQKMIAEYWADGPNSELPPGHWDLFAQFVSDRDRHSLDTDVKMFFALTNAIFDGSIVAWNAKQTFDSARPVTAIAFLFVGQQIQAWAGPYAGTQIVDGANWRPYQPSTFPTPPFPEFISGHSTFSAAGAEVLSLFTHGERFGGSVTLAAGSSKIEPGATPAHPVSLYWKSFTDAADQAGMSRRYGGIHFEAADLTGRVVGRLIGRQALAKARTFWRGIDSEDSDR
jgi:hypothetical protein